VVPLKYLLLVVGAAAIPPVLRKPIEPGNHFWIQVAVEAAARRFQSETAVTVSEVKRL
jgi:hypothetical protein